MKLKKTICFIITILILTSCQTRSESLLDPNTGAPISRKRGGAFGNEKQYESTIKSIDSNPSLLQIRSLLYSNDKGETQSVNGLLYNAFII